MELHRVRSFPELAAGGFSRIDGKVAFYLRVNALLRPDMTVLDFGAGRGAQVSDPNPFRRELARLRGKARKVIGVDLDRAIQRNPDLDEAHLLEPGGDGSVSLPLADRSVDLVVSTFVFEHVTNPDSVAAELDRVLRPGGWICALTPNAFGYIGLGNRITPEPLKGALLRRLQPRRRDEDVFPTVYRLNTGRALRRHFPPGRWLHASYTHDPEPSYAGDSSWLWGLTRIVTSFTPPGLRSLLIVLLRKETD
jgi:SAM-dependent methyltransferase